MSELVCLKHNAELECMAGRNAHHSNWYCPKCNAEINDRIINRSEHLVEKPKGESDE